MTTATVSSATLGKVVAELRRGPAAVPDVARQIGRARPTVFVAFRKLLADRVIERCGTRRDPTGYGKPAHLYRIVGQANYIRKAQDAGRRHHANNGLAALIREALKGGGMTAKELAAHLEREPKAIRSALNGMLQNGGGIYGSGSRWHYVYRLFSERATNHEPRATDSMGEFAIAQRITIGRGSYWGAGLI